MKTKFKPDEIATLFVTNVISRSEARDFLGLGSEPSAKAVVKEAKKPGRPKRSNEPALEARPLAKRGRPARVK